MNKLFERYIEKAKEADIDPRGSKESIQWFSRVVRKDRVINDITKITEGLDKPRFKPGEMMTYSYNPKTKDKLDFYDEHPLIIFLDKTKDGWYGLNLHYLSPSIRAKVFEELEYGNKGLARVAYSLSKNPKTEACLKRYLARHVVSKPKVVPKTMWEIAIALPFEKFIKESNKTVWNLSKRKRNARNR
mgnify:CR=1 FL=1